MFPSNPIPIPNHHPMKTIVTLVAITTTIATAAMVGFLLRLLNEAINTPL